MKDIQSVYRLAEKNQIHIVPFDLPETGSMALDMEDGTYYVGVDCQVLETEAQQREHLFHEVGHCMTGSFYNRYAAVECRQKHENRADRWAIHKLIPQEDLDNAIADGITEIWELAEYFGVSEDFVKKAVCLYTYGNLAAELYF